MHICGQHTGMPNLIPLTSPGRAYLIPWASSIRDAWLAHCTEGFTNAYPPELAAQASEVMVRCINQIPDPAWWIESEGNLREAFGPVWRAEMDKAGMPSDV